MSAPGDELDGLRGRRDRVLEAQARADPFDYAVPIQPTNGADVSQRQAWPSGPPPEFDLHAPPKEPAAPRVDLPQLVDLRKLAACDPPPPQFIVSGWLPQGEVTLFAGHGGTGKSAIALHLAVCIALGRPWFGIQTTERRVAYLSLEDPQAVLHWRLSKICAWIDISVTDLAGKLDLFDGTNGTAPIMVETHGGTQLTHVYEWMRGCMVVAKVLMIDGSSDGFAGNENSRAQVRAFIRSVRQLVPVDGAALVIAHVDKITARDNATTESYSGSTAWSNSVRARWSLRDARGGDLLLELQKANLVASGAQIDIRWNESADMFVGGLKMPAGRLEREMLEREERLALVELIRKLSGAGTPCPAATCGSRTAYHVLSAQDAFPRTMSGRDGKKRFWAAIESLRANGQVRVDSERTASRNYREVLNA